MSPAPRVNSTAALAFLAAGFVLSLSFPCATHAMSKPETKTVVIIETEAGKEVKVKKGETLVIKLKSQPGTGYGWELVEREKLTHLKAMGESTLEGGTGVDGGIERQVFRFEAKSTGEDKLQFRYKRPFGENEKPRKTFDVKITVVGPD